jgi:sulfur relay (sulfurtransferase) DsrC/TusE family protein
MNTRSELLLESLTKFYDDPENAEKLKDILTTKTQGISLRNLEWFVTNYAKNRHVTYNLAPSGRPFTVHVAYKSSLDGYSKKLFDPFCRTERIEFKGLSTTVAQLNFIKWCLTNGIIDYMIKDKIRPQNHS